MNDLDFTFFTKDQLEGEGSNDEDFTYFTKDQLEPDYHNSEQLRPLYSRKGKGGETEFTSFPEEFDQKEEDELENFETIEQKEGIQNEPQEIESLQEEEKEFPFEEENDLEREIERNIARGTSRIGETILGLPGDLYSFGKYLFGANPETNLPTSKSLKELSEKSTKGYTKAKNEAEEKSDEVLSDIASFMIPGSGKYNMMRNIGIPVVANLAKEGIKYTGTEKLGDAAKIGTMVVLDLMSHRKGGARKFAGNLFNESEKLIPEGAELTSHSFQKSLSNLEKTLESGGTRPSTEKSLIKVNEIQKKMKNGQIEVKELIDFRKSINEIKDSLGGFDITVPAKIKKKMIVNLDLVKKEVIGALDEYGAKHNPEFRKLNKSANEAWAAVESSEKMGKFILKSIKQSFKSPYTSTLLGLGGYGIHKAGVAGAIGKTGAISAPLVYAGYETYKVFHQILKSKTMAKYYGNILKGASAGNASQVSKNAKLLDDELAKIEE